MIAATDPIIAIVGNVQTEPTAPLAAEALGRELAKAGLRILVYSSGPELLEGCIVRGYVASRLATPRSIQVRYPLHGLKPAFPEQDTNSQAFDWQPDHRPDWEVSFYQSLNEVDGVLLMGGGESTMIAGLVAMGLGIAMLPLAGFGGKATRVWEALRPDRDLPNADEISLMARPGWTDDQAAECAKALKNQIARKAEREKQRRIDEVSSAGMRIQPIFGIPVGAPRADVFVLMPFHEDFLPIYDDHIQKVCEHLKLNSKRADNIFGSREIIDDVWELIANSKIIIADCTGRNPNVFYELGIAHTLGKQVVIIAQSDDDIPFDIRHIRYIKYSYTPRGMKEFEASLKKFIVEKRDT